MPKQSIYGKTRNRPACGGVIPRGKLFYRIIGRKDVFHDYCLRCNDCARFLQNGEFYFKNGTYYCQNDFDKKFTKKCGSCENYIRAGTYFTVASKFYHSACFRCSRCSVGIIGNQYFVISGNLQCLSCVKSGSINGVLSMLRARLDSNASPEENTQETTPLTDGAAEIPDMLVKTAQEITNFENVDETKPRKFGICFVRIMRTILVKTYEAFL